MPIRSKKGFADTFWKPPIDVQKALRRGERKVKEHEERETARHAMEDLIHEMRGSDR
jgi:hypothetical protein